jgi:hypothetical protein
MKLEYIPLLKIQRELQGLPRNYARFQQYLRTITNKEGLELPPLGIMNPMGKDHVTAVLDTLLAMNADDIAAKAAADAMAAHPKVPGEFKIALVVADDLMGGWTNRYDYEFNFRFGSAQDAFERDPESESGYRLPRWLKDFWITAVVWSSETPTERAVREAIIMPVYRFAYIHEHGPARTLRAVLAQEGHVMTAVGCAGPLLDEEEINYTREVLSPFLDASDKRTCIECLFGDEAGRTLGFTPRGLSPWAGVALALHDARMNQP